MALPKFLRTNSEPAPPRFGRLSDEAELIPVAAMLHTLRAMKRRLEREDERLILEARFAARPARGDSERDQLLLAKLVDLTSDQPAKATPAAASSAYLPEVVAALALGDGNLPPPRTDRATRRLAIAREMEVVELAYRAQDSLHGETADRLSRLKSDNLRAEHGALAVRMFRAAQEFARAADVEREFRAEILSGGYSIWPDLISPPGLTAALHLGSERQHDSQISTVRRQLEAKGLLK